LKSKSGPKIAFESPGQAMDVIRELRVLGIVDVLEVVAVYRCTHCGVWHWGRKNGAKWR
jgi:hypothetical protein